MTGNDWIFSLSLPTQHGLCSHPGQTKVLGMGQGTLHHQTHFQKPWPSRNCWDHRTIQKRSGQWVKCTTPHGECLCEPEEKELYLIITLLSYRRGIVWNSSIFFRGLSLRCFWCCNFLVWFDYSEMQDEHVAIILYICMIQALSYSLIFYRNLENRDPQFTACIVECFCIIPFTSLDFPI